MLEGIKQNVTKLIALYEGEKQRADALEAELAASRREAGAYFKQITDLNRKIDNLKLSGAFTSDSGNPVARERLDKLITEIDKCIRLLEK